MFEDHSDFPEMLSAEKLEETLRKFKVLTKREENQILKKEELLELYHRFIVPLPQRVQLRRLRNSRKPDKNTVMVNSLNDLSAEAGKGIARNTEGNTSEDILIQSPKNVIRILPGVKDKGTKPVKLKRNFPKPKDKQNNDKKCCSESSQMSQNKLEEYQTSLLQEAGTPTTEAMKELNKPTDDIETSDNRKRHNITDSEESAKPKLCKLEK